VQRLKNTKKKRKEGRSQWKPRKKRCPGKKR
jgi:hypothetical protein